MGHITAEKQAPSALDFLGAISDAVRLEKQLSKPNQSKALKDLVNKVCSEYNKLCQNKKHRIDTQRKALIYNLNLVRINMFNDHSLCAHCLNSYVFE